MRPRTLSPLGGMLTLEQPEFKQLQGYVEDTQWAAGVADVATDLENWVDMADKAA